jgi:hypothetical protein
LIPGTRRRVARQSGRWYKRMLRIYPAGFRRDYGQQMADLFDDLCRDVLQRNGVPGLLSLWWFVLGETLMTAGGLYLSQWRENMKSKQLISTILGLFFLAYSGSFVAFNVLKYNMGVNLPADPFAVLTDFGRPTVWTQIGNGLLIAGPLLALFLFLLPRMQVNFDLQGEQLVTISLNRGGRINIVLSLVSLGLLALFGLYFVAENFACLLGSQLTC